MSSILIKAFGGMKPVTDPLLLDPGMASDAVNVRLTSGALVPLPGLTTLKASNIPAPGTIWRYGNAALEADYWFEFAGDVDVIRSPIADDEYGRAYWTDGVQPKYGPNNILLSGGGNYPGASYNLGVPAPASIPTVSGAPGSGTTAETRTYVVTYVTAYGEEGPPSEATAPVSVDPAQPVTLTNLPTGPAGAYNVSLKRIYRSSTVGSSAELQYVTELAVAAGTFVDTVSQADLGEVLPSGEWFPPPAGLRGLKMLANGAAIGFVGNTIYASEPNLPHAWAHQYPIDLDIVGIGVFRQGAAVLTGGHPYFVTGADPASMSVERLELPQACLSKRSIVDTGEGCLYASTDGIVSISPGGIEVMTREILSKEQWKAYNPSSMRAFYNDGKYVVFYTTIGGIDGGLIFDFSGQGAAMSRFDTSLIPAPAVLSVSSASATEGSPLVHTVSLSFAATSAISMAYSLGGGTAVLATDYSAPTFSNGVTLSGGALSVPGGVSSFTITIQSIADIVDEGSSETYELSVGGVSATGTIVDDDDPVVTPPVALPIGWHDPVAAPGPGQLAFTVSESNSGAISGGSTSVGTANASLIGYTSGAIEWFVNGVLQAGQVGQTFGLVVSPGESQPNSLPAGTYIVTAAVDGLQSSNGLVLTVASGDPYAAVSWGALAQEIVWDSAISTWSLSSSDRVASASSPSSSLVAVATGPKSSGRWYAEAVLGLGGGEDMDLYLGVWQGSSVTGIRWTRGAGTTAGGGLAAPASLVSGAVIGMDVNVDSGSIDVYINNVFEATASFSAGALTRLAFQSDNDGVQQTLTLQELLDYSPPAGSLVWTNTAPVPAASTGWLMDIDDPINGVAAHANAGARSSPPSDRNVYAGIVGYTTGTVVWSIASWSSLFGGPSPTISQDQARADVVRVQIGGGESAARDGLLTITATVNGIPAIDEISLSIGSDSFYPNIAWGPSIDGQSPALNTFLDTFTGPVGPLTAHTPDQAPAGSSWLLSGTNGFALDGTGGVSPTGSFSNSNANANWGIGIDVTGGFELTFEAGVLSQTQGAFMALSIYANSTELAAIYVKYGRVDASIGLSSVGVSSFAPVTGLSAGSHLVSINLNGLTATLRIDGVVQQTLTITAPAPIAVHNMGLFVYAPSLPFSSYRASSVSIGPPLA